MSITNQNWLTQSLLPRDNSVTLGSQQYPLASINCVELYATDLTVTNQTTVNNTDVKDAIVTLSYGNVADVINSGLLNVYTSSGTKYAGLMRYASDSKYYLFKDVPILPTTSSNLFAYTRADLTLANLTASTATCAATTNQLMLGSTNTVTLNSTAPTASRVYTIPDATSDASFIMSVGNLSTGQTIQNNLFVDGGISARAGTASSYMFGGLFTSTDATTTNLITTDLNQLQFTSYPNATPGTRTSLLNLSSAGNESKVDLKIDTLTASKLVLTNASKTLSSSIYGISDLFVLSADNTVSGISVFNNSISANGAVTFGNTATFNNPATFNGTVSLTNALSITGVVDGSDASAGKVGEYKQTLISNVSVTGTETYGSLTSIALTAGDWEICAQGTWYQNNAGSYYAIYTAFTDTKDSNTGAVIGDTILQDYTSGIGTQTSISLVCRKNITTSKTYHLNMWSTTGGIHIIGAKISARRVR